MRVLKTELELLGQKSSMLLGLMVDRWSIIALIDGSDDGFDESVLGKGSDDVESLSELSCSCFVSMIVSNSLGCLILMQSLSTLGSFGILAPSTPL